MTSVREEDKVWFIDGLECSIFDRGLFADLQRSPVDAVTITTAFWEDALETMDMIGAWNDLERENADLIRIVRSFEDLLEAKKSGQVAIILGAQNSSPINDRLRFVELFSTMGLKVMQLTYNNQNAIGSSCYEPTDSGLTRFGKEVVSEMNRVGMLVDLSHMGERTSYEAIHFSSEPVAITHANPRSLVEHPRNKSDEVLRALAAAGGVLGLATYNNIAQQYALNVDTWVDMLSRTVDLIGIEHVAIGTDLGQNSTPQYLQWMRQGRWTRSAQPGASLSGEVPEEWFVSPQNFTDISAALTRRGRFSESEVQALLGGNWLRLYRHIL